MRGGVGLEPGRGECGGVGGGLLEGRRNRKDCRSKTWAWTCLPTVERFSRAPEFRACNWSVCFQTPGETRDGLLIGRIDRAAHPKRASRLPTSGIDPWLRIHPRLTAPPNNVLPRCLKPLCRGWGRSGPHLPKNTRNTRNAKCGSFQNQPEAGPNSLQIPFLVGWIRGTISEF